MTRIIALIGSTLVCGSFVAGCGNSTLTVVPHAMRCGEKADDAKKVSYECASPIPVPDGATYQMIVDIAKDDRQSLVECGINMDALKDVFKKCNQMTDEYNKEIDKISTKSSVGH